MQLSERDLVDVAGEYSARLRRLEHEASEFGRGKIRAVNRTHVLEAFIRDLGHTVDEAEAAWRAKGYGLGY